MPFEQYQRMGSFWELREEYRKAALESLRRREGLPTSERLLGAFYQRADGFYREPPGKEVSLDTTMYPNGNGGFVAWATGTRKGISHEDADQNWGRTNWFEILDVAEDGRRLTDELRDLDRDARGMEVSERVSHGTASEQAPDLLIEGTSDEEVDARLQEYLKRGPR
jgi:hypothetical protein